jgi:2-polyprenyl-3-methyl-5-hydroxy-6-metoxy-1,4-benzoquinol methylase
MMDAARKILRKIVKRAMSPKDCFLSYHYQRHTQRRLEHLATLGLELSGSTVLEVGAGIGDHTSFFLDRRCSVVSTEARPENLEVLRERYPNLQVLTLDLDHPNQGLAGKSFKIIYCYGVLYHLGKPAEALAFLAQHCSGMILVETCVSFGDEEALHPCAEVASDCSQSVTGHGCRPTRSWVYRQLQNHFEFVYLPVTQPSHEEFPLDWSVGKTSAPFSRAVFIGSRKPINNPLLANQIPQRQTAV